MDLVSKGVSRWLFAREPVASGSGERGPKPHASDCRRKDRKSFRGAEAEERMGGRREAARRRGRLCLGSDAGGIIPTQASIWSAASLSKDTPDRRIRATVCLRRPAGARGGKKTRNEAKTRPRERLRAASPSRRAHSVGAVSGKQPLGKARANSIVLARASRYIAPVTLTPIGIGE